MILFYDSELNMWRCKPQGTFALKSQQTGIAEKDIPEPSIGFRSLKAVGSPHFKHEPYGF